jgi:UDP-2,3-diacylglucosamine pyrophosphatase LpxH
LDWFEEAKKLYKPGVYGYKKIAKDFGISPKTVESKFLRAKKRGEIIDVPEEIDLKASILIDIQKEKTIEAICNKYKISERILYAVLEDIREAGYQVYNDDYIVKLCTDIVPQDNKIELNWNGERIIRFGLCGDHQFNSKYTQITYAHEFYKRLEHEGITRVYHTGDIDEGEEMRPGHKYECYRQGSDEHVEEIAKNYPRLKNGETWFITGNHDHSLIKRAGVDIGKQIQAARPDMKYLGMSSAMINLTPNCTLELRHPIDGTAYALSYKIQKMIDAMQGGEKPNILAVGHYHKAEYLPCYRNIHAIQTGCFQAQTPFMKGKQIAAMVGGWIIEIAVEDDGTIKEFTAKFVSFYKMIKDDYLNWR